MQFLNLPAATLSPVSFGSFAGIFIFLLFIPVYVINKTAGFIFAYYLAFGYFFCLFPQNTALAGDSDLGRAKYLSYSELKHGGLITNTGFGFRQKATSLSR
ncbi:hypothetical protein [Lactiplantibacillus plantarum]|uniref:hypothetical protein n=1 Tax=Lactiplantibacillus plantarum TaxID=1590 RepID=UPI0008FB349D|nr:hypothetical protein [Lactiplantibacillus plantarum]APB87270.1 hypothetical protein BL295_15970 [Lactiplantibacillus plantarum]